MVEIIVRGFPRSKISKNVRKMHIRLVMNVERKKRIEHNKLICFMEKDFGILTRIMLKVIFTLVYNFIVK